MFKIIDDPYLSESEKCLAILKLLETEPEALFESNFGITPLHYAVTKNLPEVVKLLINKGLNVNICGYHNITPLHMAAELGHDKLIFLLGFEGCNFNAVDQSNHSALDKAIENKHPSCLKNLFMASNLLLASEFKINDKIKANALLKIEQITDFKLQQNFIEVFDIPSDLLERTPLQLAVLDNSFEMVKFFLSIGADINERDKLGRTALHFAAQCGHTEIILLLRSQKTINLNARDCNGNTALHLAIENPGSIHLLISGTKRIDKNIKNNAGKTADELIEWHKISNPKAIKNALTIKNGLKVDKDFFNFDEKIPNNFITYLKNNFKELIIEEFHDSSTPKFFKNALKKTSSMLFPNLLEPVKSEKSSASLEWLSDKNLSFFEQIYLGKNPKLLLRTITLSQEEGKLSELMQVLNGFIETYPDELAAALLLAAVDELKPLLLEERSDFNKQVKKFQDDFYKNLLADGLDEYCAPAEFKQFTADNFSAISKDNDSIKILKKLVEICSGNMDKDRNEIKIDLNFIKIQILGLIDFIDPLQVISMLIKLNPHLSNIQRLQCNFIVFFLLETYNLYGFDVEESQRFYDEVSIYFKSFSNEEIILITSTYIKFLADFESKSLHATSLMVKEFLVNKIEIEKESILDKINEYVNHKHKKTSPLIADIANEFNYINAQFFQTVPLKVFRQQCWDSKNETCSERGDQFSALVEFIKKTVGAYPSEAKQARAIMLFLLVAQKSFYFQCPDMITIMAVFCALSQDNDRLKSALALLDKSSIKMKEVLFKLLSYDNNYKFYRELLSENFLALPNLDRLNFDKIHIYEYVDNSQSNGDEILFNSLETFGNFYLRYCFIKKNLKDISLDSKTDLAKLLQNYNSGKKNSELIITTPGIKISLPKKAELLSSTDSSSQDESPSIIKRRSSEKKSPGKVSEQRKISIGKVSPRTTSDSNKESLSGTEQSSSLKNSHRKNSNEKENHSNECSISNELYSLHGKRVTWFGAEIIDSQKQGNGPSNDSAQKIEFVLEINDSEEPSPSPK